MKHGHRHVCLLLLLRLFLYEIVRMVSVSLVDCWIIWRGRGLKNVNAVFLNKAILHGVHVLVGDWLVYVWHAISNKATLMSSI